MGLPVNIHELLNGETVEWDRIELKEGWNPEAVIHTICAFANDINNWGGGYIFIGVAENEGVAVLPPAGLAKNALDKIQKDIVALSHQVNPYYAPVTQLYVIDGKYILTIWVPGGDNRPYKAPLTLGEKGQKKYYVRRGSFSVAANEKEEQLLLEMAKRIPFDDRVNHHGKVDDLSFGLIRAYLSEVKSDLEKEIAKASLPDLALQMRIAAGPPEAILPLNIGLLFFSEAPHQYFPGARTEVIFYRDESGTAFTEKIFTGPVHIQIRAVLAYIDTNIIQEKVVKRREVKLEADRAFNFPLVALEEVVANAFYHRSYELPNPIEINCFPTRIEVLSFPGPLPPVDKAALKKERIVARNYRNRRVGDFLKELKITEGRASGFPKTRAAMQRNGSPEAVFETDDAYSYFLAVLPVHKLFVNSTEKQVEPELGPQGRETVNEQELQVLRFCKQPRKRSEIFKKIGLVNHTTTYRRYIMPLLQRGLLAFTNPDEPNSPMQKYITTEKGRLIAG